MVAARLAEKIAVGGGRFVSVVNKMLQDIDRRRAEAGPGAALSPGNTPTFRPPRRRRSRAWLWLLSLLPLVALLWWYREGMRESANEASAPAPVAAQPAASAAPVSTAPPKPIAEQMPVTATTLQPVPLAAAPIPLPAAPPASAAPDVANSVQAAEPAPKPKVKRARTADVLRLSTRLSAPAAAPAPAVTPVSTPAVSSAASAPASDPADSDAPSIAIRQVASDETVRAARALWNDGSRAAALETLRQALSAAETHRDTAAVPALGRELARLEVANNNPAGALEVMKHLESRFQDDAEIWALRGNAQQRLGQHAEAVESYQAALRLKGGESRWMLGVAISLAAQGKLDEARTWTARAAERGPISPSVLAYLKQLGVAVP